MSYPPGAGYRDHASSLSSSIAPSAPPPPSDENGSAARHCLETIIPEHRRKKSTAGVPPVVQRRHRCRVATRIQQTQPHTFPAGRLHAGYVGDRRDVIVVEPVMEPQNRR